MSIYRGAGGSGDAVADSSSEALLVRELALEVQADADAAATSAAAASSLASAAATSASNALTAENNAELAETNAETAQVAAEVAKVAAQLAETNAELAETNAETAQTAAELAETNAETAASTATTQAGIATTQAGIATTQATNAATSASTASAAASAALASLDSFDDRYLGAKSSEPTLDNDGNALVAGALYFNTVSNTMKVYTGSVWVDAYADGATFLAKANNLSDLPSASTARTNLGLGTIATQAASSVAVTGGTIDGTTIGGTAAAAVSSTNLSYTGTLTGGTGVVNLGSGQFYKDASGNVGIGVTPSTWNTLTPAVQIGQSSAFLSGQGSTEAIYVGSNAYYNSAWKYGINGFASYYRQQNGEHSFARAASGTAGNNITFLESMRIDSSGNVGIGTSSPSEKLDVFGQGQFRPINNALNNSDWFVIGSIQEASNFGVGVGVVVESDSLNKYGMTFGTKPNSATAITERMRIGSSGNVGIGTSSPNGKLVVSENGANGFEVITAFSSGTETRLNSYNRSSSAYTNLSADALIHYWLTSGTERMRIDSGGNLLVGVNAVRSAGKLCIDILPASSNGVVIYPTTNNNYDALKFLNNAGTQIGYITCTTTATAYNTSSDYRLKENIAPMTGALSVVQQLKPVTYNWKADGSSGQGFIAHELQAVVPDCVTGEKDAVDAEGKPVYQGIDTSFLVATLTKAIQEQQVMIEELKAKVAALEAA